MDELLRFGITIDGDNARVDLQQFNRELERVQRVARGADRGLDDLADTEKRMDRDLRSLNRGLDKLEDELDDVERQTRKTTRATNAQLGAWDRWSIRITGINQAIGLVQRGLSVLDRTVLALPRAVVRTGATFEALETRLVGLTGSAEAARAEFERMVRISVATPFTLTGVVNAGITLRAFGVEAQGALTAVTDLAAFLQTDVVFAAEAVGRAFSGGFGAADVLRDRGILNLVKQQTGVNDLSKLSQGAFEAALIRVLQSAPIKGQADALSQTFDGIILNIQGMIEVALNKIAEAGFFDAVKEEAQSFLDLLNRLDQTGQLDELAKQISDVLGEGLREVSDLVDGIDVVRVTETAVQLGVMALHMASLVGSILGLLGQLPPWLLRAGAGAAVGSLFGPLGAGVGGSVAALFPFMQPAATATSNPLTDPNAPPRARVIRGAGNNVSPPTTPSSELNKAATTALANLREHLEELRGELRVLRDPTQAIAVEMEAMARALEKAGLASAMVEPELQKIRAVQEQIARESFERGPLRDLQDEYRVLTGEITKSQLAIERLVAQAPAALKPQTEALAQQNAALAETKEQAERLQASMIDLGEIGTNAITTMFDAMARGTLEMEQVGESIKASIIGGFVEGFKESFREKLNFEGAFKINIVGFLQELGNIVSGRGSGGGVGGIFKQLAGGLFGQVPGVAGAATGATQGGGFLAGIGGLGGLIAAIGAGGLVAGPAAGLLGHRNLGLGITGISGAANLFRGITGIQALANTPGIGGGALLSGSGGLTGALSVAGIGLGIHQAVTADSDRGRAAGGLNAAAGAAALFGPVGLVVSGLLALTSLVISLTDEVKRETKQRSVVESVQSLFLERNIAGAGRFARQRIPVGEGRPGRFGGLTEEQIAFGAIIAGGKGGGSERFFAAQLGQAARRARLDVDGASQAITHAAEAMRRVNQVFEAGRFQAEFYEKAVQGLVEIFAGLPDRIASRIKDSFLDDGKANAREVRRFINRDVKPAIQATGQAVAQAADLRSFADNLLDPITKRFQEQFSKTFIDQEGALLAEPFFDVRDGFRRLRRRADRTGEAVTPDDIAAVIASAADALNIAVGGLGGAAELLETAALAGTVFAAQLQLASGDFSGAIDAVEAGLQPFIQVLEGVRELQRSVAGRVDLITGEGPFARQEAAVAAARRAEEQARARLTGAVGLDRDTISPDVFFSALQIGSGRTLDQLFGAFLGGQDDALLDVLALPGAGTNAGLEAIGNALEGFADLDAAKQLELLQEFADKRLSTLEAELQLAQAQQQFFEQARDAFEDMLTHIDVLRRGEGASLARAQFDSNLDELKRIAPDALAGDTSAIARALELAPALLSAGQELFGASSPLFVDLLDFLEPLLGSLVDLTGAASIDAAEEVARVRQAAEEFKTAFAPLLTQLEIKAGDVLLEQLNRIAGILGDNTPSILGVLQAIAIKQGVPLGPLGVDDTGESDDDAENRAAASTFAAGSSTASGSTSVGLNINVQGTGTPEQHADAIVEALRTSHHVELVEELRRVMHAGV